MAKSTYFRPNTWSPTGGAPGPSSRSLPAARAKDTEQAERDLAADVVRLAEGLHRYRPMPLVLAVDTSRKHAGTQSWVRQLARVAEPASVLAVPRTVTASPGTVRDLGYPVHQPSDVAARLPW
jgi:hypothetical protein